MTCDISMNSGFNENFPKADIKHKPSDFIVEEIMPNGRILELDEPFNCEDLDPEGKFVHFVLQKTNWDTNSALQRVGRALHIGKKRFNHGGTKDKFAVTVQRVSGFAIDKDKLLDLKLKDIKILGAWKEKEKVQLGNLAGNRFKIRVYTSSLPKMYPLFFNFFGPQRFGSSRCNTHLMGKDMMMGDYKGAVLRYLLDTKGEKSEIATTSRHRLEQEMDFKQALQYFPKYLRYERMLLGHLADYPTDFIGAIRTLPRSTSLMFIHAYQSYIFNKCLAKRILDKNFEPYANEYKCNINKFGYPDVSSKNGDKILVMNILGYESKTNELEDTVLEEEGITLEHFKLRSMPELSSKGNFRTALSIAHDLKIRKEEKIEEEKINENKIQENNIVEEEKIKVDILEDTIMTEFSLQPGSYASTFLLHYFTFDSLQGIPGFSLQCKQESIDLLSSSFFGHILPEVL